NLFTGRSVGDLLLGLPSALALTSFSVIDQGQTMYFAFVQDDYKVSQVLSVNVGLRYEYSTPPIERHNRLANFDPLTGTIQSAKDGSAFVRLRFPGYACACIDSGIPQGWMRKKVAEVCALID